MALPGFGTNISQQAWDESVNRLIAISSATVQRNQELEARLAHLELELSIWKQAHAGAVEAVERVNPSGLSNGQIPLVLVVIDGDTNVFDSAFLSQGQNGGRQAGQQLTQSIAEYLSQLNDVNIDGRVSFWVTIYFSKNNLRDSLASRGACTVDQFDQFCFGFSQASPRFLLIDVGPKEGTESKIAEYLQTYIRFPQTLRLFLGPGPHSFAVVNSLAQEGLLRHMILLSGDTDAPAPLARFRLPTLRVAGLFARAQEPRTPTSPVSPPQRAAMGISPVYSAGSPLSLTSSGSIWDATGLESPQSSISSTLPPASGPRVIDPTKPLHRQTPPPCNEFYLMTCTKGSSCKYCHDYNLTPEELETLAANAKKAPCNFLKKGLPCANGDSCCWGHECPNGPECFHYSKGKCWFKGENMHSGQSTTSGVTSV